MAAFLLFATAAIGLTNIMVDSTLMAPLRRWLQSVLPASVYEVFECHQCMGTWCGLICGLLLLVPAVHFLLYAFAGSFLATFAYVLYELALSKTDFEINIGGEDEAQES